MAPPTRTTRRARAATTILAAALLAAAIAAPEPGPHTHYVTVAAGITPERSTTLVQQLTTPEQTSTYASSVDAATDLLVIGAPDEPNGGIALVYTRDGHAWTQAATLSAPEPEPGDQFGTAVAVIDDGTIAVSAPGASAVHLYTPSPDGWAHSAAVHAPASHPGQFGTALALSSSTLAVAHPAQQTATVHLYARTSSSSWAPTQTLTAPTGADGYGTALDLDHTTLAVGAPGDTTAGTTTGRVYLYAKSATWEPAGSLLTHEATPDAQLGAAIALHGDTLLVGAPTAPDRAGADTGAAYVFTRTADHRWTQTLKLPGPAAAGQHGAAVAAGPQTLAVGAPGAGATTLYAPTGTTWQQLPAQDGTQDTRTAGCALAVTGTSAVILDCGPR